MILLESESTQPYTCLAMSILLHAVVCWPPTALWADPVDVLAVVLDVARLAVDAVLRVDHQAHPVLTVLPSHVLVHAWQSGKVL